jgi:putative acetyltransferase
VDDAIRNSTGLISPLSLVTEQNGQIVGHVLFSRIHIQTENGPLPALALAPLAVLPEYQQQGIGSALVQQGLRECKHHQENQKKRVRCSAPICGKVFPLLPVRSY